MNRAVGAACLIVLMLSMVGAPILSAHAVDLTSQTWDDYYPFTIQFSFVQASGVADNFTARGGSTAAYALHTLSYAEFSANATDVYNYTLDIQYQIPISQFISVTVVSSDKIKTFTIPIYNETDVRIGFIFTLEQQPVIPTAADIAAIAEQQNHADMVQIINSNEQVQSTQNSNLDTMALVIVLQLIVIAILGAAVIRLWKVHPR